MLTFVKQPSDRERGAEPWNSYSAAGNQAAARALDLAVLHYGEKSGPENLARLRHVDPRFGAYIEDFALVSRLAEFEAFCGDRKGALDLNLPAIRAAFSDTLRPITAYRCLGLREAADDDLGYLYRILTEGISARFTIRCGSSAEEYERLKQKGLSHEIEIRAHGQSSSLLQGVSVYPEVAINEGAAHASHYHRKLLLTLSIPALSTIRPGAHGIRMGAGLDDLKEEGGGRLMTFGEKVFFRPLDRDYELFVLGKIPNVSIMRAQWLPDEMIPSCFIPSSWATRGEWEDPCFLSRFVRIPEPPPEWRERLSKRDLDVEPLEFCRQREAMVALPEFVRRHAPLPITGYDPGEIWYQRIDRLEKLEHEMVPAPQLDGLLGELEVIGRMEHRKGMDPRVASVAFSLIEKLAGRKMVPWDPITERCLSPILEEARGQ